MIERWIRWEWEDLQAAYGAQPNAYEIALARSRGYRASERARTHSILLTISYSLPLDENRIYVTITPAKQGSINIPEYQHSLGRVS